MEGVTLSTVAQDLSAHLPSACLPLPSPHTDSAQECPTRGTPVPAWALPILAEAFLMEHLWPVGQGLSQSSGCSNAPSRDGGGVGGMWASQDLCPRSFYQRHGRA